MLVVSFALHAALALTLAGLQRGSIAEPPEQQVALVWADQAPGAGDAVNSAAQSAETLPPEQLAAPPSPGAEAVHPTVPEAEPEAPVATAERDPVPDAGAPPPLPPPPAPPAPPRSPLPTSPRSAAPPAPSITETAATTTPMAQGAGQAFGAVVPARIRAGAVNAPPVYPQGSRIRNEQGRATLQVTIDPTGRAADVRIMVSSGFPALDQAAIEAVRRWRFEAALREGQPVLSTVAIGITFQLEGDRRW